MYRFLPALSLLSLAAAANPSVHVRGLDVTYQGFVEDGVEQFRSIYYGQDTSGANRFRPPQPFVPEPSSTIAATQKNVACVQPRGDLPPFTFNLTDIGEDCLSLRIARPAGTPPDAKLPVLVWLYGGGIRYGSVADDIYDPRNLTLYSQQIGQPVIYAAINYRLGMFGFAASKELKGEKAMNNGLRDQRLGLEWIKAHIADFGGDPDRITGFGQSAGGTTFSLQALAWGGERELPFNQIISFSGLAGNVVNTTRDATVMYTSEIASRLGCVDSTTKEADLKCLRSVDMEDLLRIESDFAENHNPPYGLLIWLPSIDGDLFPDRQSQLTRAGKAAKGLNIVATWTHDEGSLMVGVPGTLKSEADVETAIRKYHPVLSRTEMDGLLALYPIEDFEDKVQRFAHLGISAYEFKASQIIRDALFTCLTLDYTSQMARNAGARIYLGDLNHTAYHSSMGGPEIEFVGVTHVSELPHVFHNRPRFGEWRKIDEEMSDKYAASVIGFAYTGSPNADRGFQNWPEAFRHEEGRKCIDYQVLGGPLGSGPVSFCEGEDEVEEVESLEDAGQPLGMMDQLVLGGAKVSSWVGSMLTRSESEKAAQRLALAKREKLFERCAYIDSLQETMGI